MTDEPTDNGLDLDRVRRTFEDSTDFTVGLEEEFAIVDPQTLDLQDRYEELFDACQDDELLKPSVCGELIASEIEIRSGKGETFAQAADQQRAARDRLFALVDSRGLALAACGTHPWADYRDQKIIDTEHYRLLRHELGWVAQRNNTWSLHVHVGIKGADRAVAVCDWMRQMLPLLLAVSANSPFLDNRHTGLHSVRSEIFTRTFPRCGVPNTFGDWKTYANFVALLERTGSIIEATQLWWSVRPHHAFGTVEVRICDAQTRGDESLALAALITAVVAQAALAIDEHGYGAMGGPSHDRIIEENLWRAIRHGLEAELIDHDGQRVTPVRELLKSTIAWCAPAMERLGVELSVPESNGAQRANAAFEGGASIEQIYRDAVAETRRTYAPGGVVG